MKNKKEYTNDELEELELVECCSHCYNLGIIIREDLGNKKYCTNCSLVDSTIIMPEEEWDTMMNDVKC